MAAQNATASYEGGAGGKIRRRPLHRAATPYDRPPIALRNPSAERSGWLSKLVDPASKIISSSASRLFSSVFRKRLVGPPSASEMNLEHRNEVPKDTCSTPSGAQELGSKKEDNPSNDNGTNELEQLLKQMTFTRVEFNRLSELLRSRTVDLFAGDENKRTEPSASQAPMTYVGQEKATISPQNATTSPQINGAGRLGLFGSTSTPGIKTSAVVEEAGSPAELAKAYMGTRLSKVSPPLHLQSRTSREDVTSLHIVPSSVHSSMMPSATRSSGRLSGLSDNGHLTQTPRGRSALYSMARSPYFRGFEPTDDRYASPSTSSQWPRTNKMLPTSKQVLKRRSSVLDDDFGSVGPIRRIRQKSSMMSPSKDQGLNSMPRLSLVSDSIHGSTSRQKANLLNQPKHITANSEDVKDGDDKVSNGSSIAVPLQSSEMARKILQQLDKIVPSPKEKSSELKLAMAREKSPSKLTLDMLNGRALKSMKDVESPKLQHVQDSGSLNGMSSTQLVKPNNLASEKQDKVGEKHSMKTSELSVMSASEASGMDNAVPVEHIPSVVKPIDHVVSGPTAAFQQNKRAFQMSAPEDSLEIDDDDDAYSRKSTFIPPAAEKEKPNSALSDCKAASETVIVEKPHAAPKSEPSTNFMLQKGADLTSRVPDRPGFAEKAVGFSFPTPAPSIPNPTNPLSTSQSPSLPNPPVPTKEQTGSVAFSFGSKSSDKGPSNFTFSSTVNKVSDAFSLNSGAGSDSKPELLNSNASTPMTSPATSEAVASDKGEKPQEASKLKRPLENVVSSSISTSSVPNIFSFGASTNSSQSNGFPTSSAISVSASLTNVASSSSMQQVFFSSDAATTGSSLTSILATSSTSAPSNFKFGSVPSTDAASSSVAAPSVSSGLELMGVESKTKSSLLFNTTGSSLLAASSPSFTSTTSSSIFGFSSSAPSSTSNSSSAANHSQSSTPFGATSGSIFGAQMAPASSSFTAFAQTTPSQFGSSSSAPLFGSSGSSSFSSSGSSSFASASSFGSATDGAKLFGSGFGPSSAASFSTGGSPFGSSSSSFPSSGTTTLFGSSSQPATSSTFSVGFGSTSLSTGFSFGASTTAGTMPPAFGSSLGASSGSSMFSFTSAGPAASSSALSPVRPVFGMSNPGFGSSSPGNDQMNVEDSMAEDTIQAIPPVGTPAFGQPASTPASSNFVFGLAAPPGGSSVFQLGGHQNPATPQNPFPFSATGNLDIPTGGSFSLGTGGDKSNRKFVKVRRDNRHRKK